MGGKRTYGVARDVARWPPCPVPAGGMLPPGHLYLCDVGYGGNTLTVPVLIPPKEQLIATQSQ